MHMLAARLACCTPALLLACCVQDLRQELLAGLNVGGGGRKGGGAGGAALGGGCADPSQLVNEIKARGGHAARIAADFDARRADIAAWAAEVRTFKAADMAAVGRFVEALDGRLAGLYDECAELRAFGEWPEARYDSLKLAAAQYKCARGRVSHCVRWQCAAQGCACMRARPIAACSLLCCRLCAVAWRWLAQAADGPQGGGRGLGAAARRQLPGAAVCAGPAV